MKILSRRIFFFTFLNRFLMMRMITMFIHPVTVFTYWWRIRRWISHTWAHFHRPVWFHSQKCFIGNTVYPTLNHIFYKKIILFFLYRHFQICCGYRYYFCFYSSHLLYWILKMLCQVYFSLSWRIMISVSLIFTN